MDYIIGIVNYFMVPLITLGVYLSLKKEAYEFSLKNLVRYGVFTTLLVPLMHLVLLVPKKTIGVEITPYSSKYTVIAIVLSVVFGFITFWISEFFSFRREDKVKDKNEKA